MSTSRPVAESNLYTNFIAVLLALRTQQKSADLSALCNVIGKQVQTNALFEDVWANWTQLVEVVEDEFGTVPETSKNLALVRAVQCVDEEIDHLLTYQLVDHEYKIIEFGGDTWTMCEIVRLSRAYAFDQRVFTDRTNYFVFAHRDIDSSRAEAEVAAFEMLNAEVI